MRGACPIPPVAAEPAVEGVAELPAVAGVPVHAVAPPRVGGPEVSLAVVSAAAAGH